MGVARYGICEQRKYFPGMKKKLMLNLILILILRLAAALYSMVKNMTFWPACLGRCGQIKSFGVNIVSVFKTSENKPVWLISLYHSWKTFLSYSSCVYTSSFIFIRIKICFKSFVTLITKLRNFFNICSRGIIQSVMERF